MKTRFTKLDDKVLRDFVKFKHGLNVKRVSRGWKPINQELSFRTRKCGIEFFYPDEDLPFMDCTWAYFDECVKLSGTILTGSIMSLEGILI